jgi:membrane protein DedA with SNARE-associated domain
MSPTLSAYIIKYGYIAIFSLVFLQEIGVPNPVPNELVLLFSGYLTGVEKLNLIVVLITVIAADTMGSSLLYMVFYYFGQRLLQKWPNVIPSSKLAYFTARVSRKDLWSIYLGRLIPFVRGYTAVAAGLLKIPPGIFFPAVLFSALTWSGGYVIAGRLLGEEYPHVISKLSMEKFALVGLALLLIIIFLWPRIYHWLVKS